MDETNARIRKDRQSRADVPQQEWLVGDRSRADSVSALADGPMPPVQMGGCVLNGASLKGAGQRTGSFASPTSFRECVGAV